MTPCAMFYYSEKNENTHLPCSLNEEREDVNMHGSYCQQNICNNYGHFATNLPWYNLRRLWIVVNVILLYRQLGHHAIRLRMVRKVLAHAFSQSVVSKLLWVILTNPIMRCIVLWICRRTSWLGVPGLFWCKCKSFCNSLNTMCNELHALNTIDGYTYNPSHPH